MRLTPSTKPTRGNVAPKTKTTPGATTTQTSGDVTPAELEAIAQMERNSKGAPSINALNNANDGGIQIRHEHNQLCKF